MESKDIETVIRETLIEQTPEEIHKSVDNVIRLLEIFFAHKRLNQQTQNKKK